jgi:hypothetical protein
VVQGVRVGLKINAKGTKTLSIEIIEDKRVMFSKAKMNQVDSLNYLGGIISKDGGCSEDVHSRIAKVQDVFSHLKKVWKIRKISLRTRIRTLEATLRTVVKYGSEAWVIRKTEENLLDVFQKNYLEARITRFFIKNKKKVCLTESKDRN